MKIIITEDQYNILLLRRFGLIEPEFKYRLAIEDPCDHDNFERYFAWISYRVEDTVFYKMEENEKLNLDLGQSRKLRESIITFIYHNFRGDAKKYYDKYIKKLCPEKWK